MKDDSKSWALANSKEKMVFTLTEMEKPAGTVVLGINIRSSLVGILVLRCL